MTNVSPCDSLDLCRSGVSFPVNPHVAPPRYFLDLCRGNVPFPVNPQVTAPRYFLDFYCGEVLLPPYSEPPTPCDALQVNNR